MILYDVRDRFTGETRFTAEINCDESAEDSVKLRLAVEWWETWKPILKQILEATK